MADQVARRDRLAALALVGLLISGAGTLIIRSVVNGAAHQHADPSALRDAVLLDRFSARRERSAEGDRLRISVRLRTSATVSLPCFVFVIARNDQSVPKRWSIWPPQPPGPAITASGHFHAATPTAGAPFMLSDTWARVNATIPSPEDGASYDSVAVYVVDESGRVLLARPFRL
ncbi:MAG: hypothetical protein AB7V27_12885 [Candidatus Binatia bacterium]